MISTIIFEIKINLYLAAVLPLLFTVCVMFYEPSLTKRLGQGQTEANANQVPSTCSKCFCLRNKATRYKSKKIESFYSSLVSLFLSSTIETRKASYFVK